jgi:hypothetical protein
MRTLILLSLVVLSVACSPNPDDCTVKHDFAACRKLCESGKGELQHMCFTERAVQMLACLEKNEGCAEACENWKVNQQDETRREYFVANIGAKHDEMAGKCGGAAPAATP